MRYRCKNRNLKQVNLIILSQITMIMKNNKVKMTMQKILENKVQLENQLSTTLKLLMTVRWLKKLRNKITLAIIICWMIISKNSILTIQNGNMPICNNRIRMKKISWTKSQQIIWKRMKIRLGNNLTKRCWE